MAYCLNADVVNEFKKLDTTGIITTAKIDGWIAQADAYINGRVGLIYTTPITGTDALLIMKQISIGLTADRIKNILKTKSAVTEASQEFPTDLIKQAKDDLQLIADRKLVLSDAEVVSSDGGVSSYTSENEVDMTFQRNTDQW